MLVQHHFNTHIYRPFLTGTRRKYKVNQRSDVIKENSGKKRFDTETRTKGCVDPAFIAKHNLSHKKKLKTLWACYFRLVKINKLRRKWLV